MNPTKLFTIGFTGKAASVFFSSLIQAGVKQVIDIRLHNVSQLAGFAKRDDLRYFLKSIGGIEYVHRPDLAPTQELLDAYKKNKSDWSVYEQLFLALLSERKVERNLTRDFLDHSCLLCSEDKPKFCHRRLVGEYITRIMGNFEIIHL